MSRIQLSDPIALWRAIEQAGGVQAYVNAQLTERGFLVQRRETDKMSDREKEAYKKSLKAEAEERRRLSREAWARGSSGPMTAATTSGTCPTPRPAPPRTSCRRSTRPSNWPRPSA